MTKAKKNAAYKSAEAAIDSPGLIYRHYKGGIYRRLREVTVATSAPINDGDKVYFYEHLFPHEHSFFVRPVKEWKDDVAVAGSNSQKRFELVSSQYEPNDEELFVCNCRTKEHQFVLEFDPDLEWPDLYLTPYLSTQANIFERIIYAFKYVFGWACGKGAFTEVILKHEDIIKMKRLVDRAYDRIIKDPI